MNLSATYTASVACLLAVVLCCLLEAETFRATVAGVATFAVVFAVVRMANTYIEPALKQVRQAAAQQAAEESTSQAETDHDADQPREA